MVTGVFSKLSEEAQKETDAKVLAELTSILETKPKNRQKLNKGPSNTNKSIRHDANPLLFLPPNPASFPMDPDPGKMPSSAPNFIGPAGPPQMSINPSSGLPVMNAAPSVKPRTYFGQTGD